MDSQHRCYNFTQMRDSIQTMQRMYRWGSILKWIPGIGSALREYLSLPGETVRLNHGIAMIDSMTLAERNNPDCITYERCMRIARGSGTKAQEVQDLISRFITARRFFDDNRLDS